MTKAQSFIGADRCSLFLANKTGDHLVTSFSKGVEGSIEIPIDKGIAGKTFTEKQIIGISDAYSHPSFDPTTDNETGYKTHSILAVPIISRSGEVIGVTEMVNKQNSAHENDENGFTEGDEQFMKIFNVFVGISIENARLFKENSEVSQHMQTLFDTTFEISTGEDVQKMLNQVITNARKSCEAEAATLFLVEGDTFKPTVSDGGKTITSQPISLGLIGEVYKTQNPIISNDCQNDKRFNPEIDKQTGFKTISAAVAPVYSRDKANVIGVVEMINKPNGFIQKDLDLLKSFASFATLAIESSPIQQAPAPCAPDISNGIRA